jgi:tetratricopeptide (TPR) repeat protein
MDPCYLEGDDLTESDKCPNQPDGYADVPRTNSTFATKVISFVFKHLGITDVNVTGCVSDVSNSGVRFKDFATDLKHRQYKSALEELSRGISGLANAVTTCGVKEVQTKIDALAAAVKFANISTYIIDDGAKILIGASDLWKDLEYLQAAIESKNPDSVGDALTKLLDDWTSVEGGCQSGQKICQWVDGLLRTIAATAKEVEPCEEALSPAFNDFEAGVQLFKAKSYKNATVKFATGLDVLAKATTSDACGLKAIANTIGNISPKLEAAIVKIEDSQAVHIIVGSADIYDVLYTMVADFDKQDYAGVGEQIGLLLAKLKASSCQTEMCIVVEGILGSLQVGFTDFEECKSDLDTAWAKLQSLEGSLEKKQWSQALLDLGDLIKDLGDAVNGCGLQSIGTILQNTASKLHANGLAADLGMVVQMLVKGADITPDIRMITVDIVNKNWASLGSDLGQLSTWIESTNCHTITCKIMEGLLNEADMALTNLKPCEDTLQGAEAAFINGAELWGRKGHMDDAIKYWASGLNQLAKAVDACGLPKELSYLEQEANVLGLGNVTVIGTAVSILVHGSDIYEEMYAAWQAYSTQDFKTAGAELQKALSSMYQWTTGHLCTSDACYVFSGILQYFSDLAKDIKKCGHDMEDMLDNFDNAFHLLSANSQSVVDSNSWISGFTRNHTAIEAGIAEIGKGINDLANSVSDCHLADLLSILTALAAKLGIVPELKIVEEILKILIDGVEIEREIANALEDWSEHNWAGFGYNLIKLVKSLLKADHGKLVANSDAIVI